APPDGCLPHAAAPVGVGRPCAPLRREQPGAIPPIAAVPAEPAPPEVRDEVLDRVDLLWSVLGPPEWTAAVLGHPEPALSDGAKVRVSDAAPAAATPDELDAPAEASPDDTIDEAGEKASEESAPVDIASTPAGAEGEDDAESEGTPPEPDYDAYDEVEGLMPPPPRLRRGGVPRSMYPRRRRLVPAPVVLPAGALPPAGAP